jgi:hypothetical protein
MSLLWKYKQCDQWHLAFCGGGCVVTTQAPPPEAKFKNYGDKQPFTTVEIEILKNTSVYRGYNIFVIDQIICYF